MPSRTRRNRVRNQTLNMSSQQPINRLVVEENIHSSNSFLSHDVNEWINNINSINISCCGANEKKNASKNNKTETLKKLKETLKQTRALPDSIEEEEEEIDDHKIEHILQQHADKIEIDDDLKDLFGKKEITKAIINQLAQRALTAPMNSNSDDPPRICTKKHCSFANEPLTIKPVTCVPGIGPIHGNLCEKQGIVMAHQLLSRYMTSANDEEFEKSLVDQLGFTPKSAAMTRDGLKEMRRHLI